MNIESRKKSMEALDHHDLPTEPQPLLIPTLFTENLPGQADPFDYATIPAPLAYVPSASTNFPGYPGVARTPDVVYAGQDVSDSSIEEESKSTPPIVWQLRRIIPFGLMPFGVGMCFVSIQCLLLVRFIAKICNLPTALPWVRTVYTLSDVVLLPLYALLPPLTQAIFARIEPYTILAIVLYGLCSRMIVRLLKLLLRMRFLAA
jgi:hypothetical protein